MYGLYVVATLVFPAFGLGRSIVINWRTSWATREIINKNLKPNNPTPQKNLYIILFCSSNLGSWKLLEEKNHTDTSLWPVPYTWLMVLILSRLLVQDLISSSSKEAGLASSPLHVQAGFWEDRWFQWVISHGRLIRSLLIIRCCKGPCSSISGLVATLGTSNWCRSEGDVNWFCHALEARAFL